MQPDTSTTGTQRLSSIDMLRGIVMALMAVDHVRGFVAPTGFDPTDLEQTTTGFFLTRWVTHFCAPVFVLLAGVGAGLWARKQTNPWRVSRFLMTRGLWLIAVEFLVVNQLWFWSIQGSIVVFQVIWAIGASMLILAAFSFLPARLVGALGILMIAGHHLLDGISLAGPLGSNDLEAMLWMVLHEPGAFLVQSSYVQVVYPLVPWVGVMFAGWSLAGVFSLPAELRDRRCRQLGLGLILFFVLLRWSNLYGDPSAWQVQERGALFSVLSFFNCTKYPVSLLYLCMTLGPALLVLPNLQRSRGALGRCFVVLGQVPLFYYILHIGLISVISALYALSNGLPLSFWAQPVDQLEGYQPSLPLVWLLSVLVVGVLYLPCRWFAGLKQRRRDWWLRYL